jgi:hypothetical protein
VPFSGKRKRRPTTERSSVAANSLMQLLLVAVP